MDCLGCVIVFLGRFLTGRGDWCVSPIGSGAWFPLFLPLPLSFFPFSFLQPPLFLPLVHVAYWLIWRYEPCPCGPVPDLVFSVLHSHFTQHG